MLEQKVKAAFVVPTDDPQPVQQELVRPERHSYVPVDSNMRDGNGNHPNDKEPRTAACIQALNARGDSDGQGLDGFWKWGFAAGFNAALAEHQPQPVAQPVQAQPRTLTVRELADVTAPWSNVWTDQSFGIANAAIAKFCEVNGIAVPKPANQQKE